MMRTQGKLRVWVGVLVAFLLVPLSQAVLFVSTGDPSYNTNAPSGSLTNSGWQYEGQWSEFLGTPIAPTFFLTAHHVNGSVGAPIILNGFSYTTVAFFDDPSTDLRIWQVAETFPYYAPLYTGTSEVGSTCMMFGRGTDRGPAVIVGTKTNGWQWGNTNNIERWGQNSVSEISTAAVTDPHPGAELLTTAFKTGGTSNECGLSINDSGGGVFIQDGGPTGTWKLVGINYEIDNPFISTNGLSGSGLNAVLTDYFHVYLFNGSNWVQFTQHYSAQFYSTRVSARTSWINSIINSDLGNDLGITGVQTSGSDTLIDLITGSNRFYRVDYTTDLVSAVWTTLTNNVPGTGGVVTVTDPGGAGQPTRYYRAAVLP